VVEKTFAPGSEARPRHRLYPQLRRVNPEADLRESISGFGQTGALPTAGPGLASDQNSLKAGVA